MQTFQDFIDKAIQAQASDEFHQILNTVIGIVDVYKQLESCGAELHGDYILRFTVSLDCLNELNKYAEQTTYHPSKSLPYYWFRIQGGQEGKFKIDFQTEPYEMFWKEKGQENYKPVTH